MLINPPALGVRARHDQQKLTGVFYAPGQLLQINHQLVCPLTKQLSIELYHLPILSQGGGTLQTRPLVADLLAELGHQRIPRIHGRCQVQIALGLRERATRGGGAGQIEIAQGNGLEPGNGAGVIGVINQHRPIAIMGIVAQR